MPWREQRSRRTRRTRRSKRRGLCAALQRRWRWPSALNYVRAKPWALLKRSRGQLCEPSARPHGGSPRVCGGRARIAATGWARQDGHTSSPCLPSSARMQLRSLGPSWCRPARWRSARSPRPGTPQHAAGDRPLRRSSARAVGRRESIFGFSGPAQPASARARRRRRYSVSVATSCVGESRRSGGAPSGAQRSPCTARLPMDVKRTREDYGK